LLPAALVIAAAGGLWSMRGDVSSTPVAYTAIEPALNAASAPASPLTTDLFRTIARQQNPVVVAIMTKARVEVLPGEGDPFRWFFGGPEQPESQVQRGLGSGFLISREGDILTNNHVVAGAEAIEVSLFGDETKTYKATLVGRDPLSDTALIRLQQPPANLPVATLGDSDALEPGDWVMAIGNPFQLGHTVTVGVVSYQGRPFQVEEGRWQKMIQTDASINPGNSGGPLINVRSEVVGINAAILGAGSGGNIGIGFAIPINSVKTLLPQLRQGKVVRGRIGVQLRGGPMSEDDARALGLGKAAGAIVTSVERGSPADRAGLRAGDVVVKFNGSPVASADDLVPRVSSTSPGTQATLTVIRDGREVTLQVTVEELTTDGGAATRPNDISRDFGLQLGDVTPSIARQLGLPSGLDGAVVYDVADDSPAGRAGMQQGDIVRSVNRRAVHRATQAVQELRRIETGQPAFLIVWRDGNETLVQMRKE
jgi:serine protease Do